MLDEANLSEGRNGTFQDPTHVCGDKDLGPDAAHRPTPGSQPALRPPTVHRDGAQDDPRGPLREVLDEHQGHESADHDEVGLLQHQGPLPVDAHHAHRPEVPDGQEQGRVVHGHVVGLEHFPAGPQLSPAGPRGLSAQVRSRHSSTLPAPRPLSPSLGFPYLSPFPHDIQPTP